ncbi:MAG: hypothetical protein JST75_11725 [Bacteroidetes bacterium]|nr:hypothetical protein [Bacteroidota bacterium]
MKGAIVYKSKYGATRQYADWLGSKFKLPVMNADNLDSEKLDKYDFIVIGSSTYVGRLLLADWIRKNVAILQEKILFLFIVGATAPTDNERRDQILRDNIPDSLLNKHEIFFLPGRLDLKMLSWQHRVMIKLAAFVEKDPEKKKIMQFGTDAVKKENLDSLEEAISHLISKENKMVETGISD